MITVNYNIKISKLNYFIILFALIFISTNNLFGQISIVHYSFESGTDNNIFIQTASKSVNTVTNDIFTRNPGNSVSSIYGVFELNKNIRKGKAIFSNDWVITENDPGNSALKYYSFKVNTKDFSGIGLMFDLWTNENNGVNKFGILYSVDGNDFSTLGTYDISQNPGIVYCFNLNFSNISDLNNKSEITFRIYGYKANNSSSFLAIDNMTVTAKKSYGNI
jgi:hypothetical protein